MTSESGCPDPRTLQTLIEGELSGDDEARLEQHLSECEACQAALERAASATRLVGQLPDQLSDDATRVTPALAGAMDRLRSDVRNGNTPVESDEGGGIDLSALLKPSNQPDVMGSLGEYDVLGVIGRGGMGVVLKGYEPSLNRYVAIKVLAPALALDRLARQRFMREARTIAAVSHRNVVTIHRVADPADGTARTTLPYLVMEFVDGESLQQRIDRDGRLGLAETVRIGSQIASGLAAAHGDGVIHRDIKPANILLDARRGDVRITDFGLARADHDVSVTRTGVVAGTPAYMSPEQAQGERVDHRTDLFSLGSVLYAMLTGRAPFEGTSPMQLLGRVCDADTTPLDEHDVEIPSWMRQIIARLHARDPADRFQSANAVRKALRSGVQSGRERGREAPSGTTQTESNGDVQTAWLRNAKRPAMVLAVMGVVLLLGLGITSLIHRDGASVESDTSMPNEAGAAVAEQAMPPPSEDDTAAASDGQTNDDKEKGVEPAAMADVNPAPGDETAPFVILDLNGDFVRRFASMREALIGALPNAVIEIRGNGPFVAPPVRIDRKPLTIRAGRGYRPRVIAAPGPRALGDTFIEARSGLALEGIEIHLPPRRNVRPGQFAAPPRTLVVCSSGSLHLANCRLMTTSQSPPVVINGADSCRIRNCEIYTPDSSCIDWTPTVDSSLEIANCVMAGASAATIQFTGDSTGRSGLQFVENSIACADVLELRIGQEAPLDSSDLPNPVSIFLRSSVLDVHRSLLRIHAPDDYTRVSDRFQPFQTPDWLRNSLMWRGGRNLIGQPEQFLTWAPFDGIVDGPPPWTPRRLFGWHGFWGMPNAQLAWDEPVKFEFGRPDAQRALIGEHGVESFRLTNRPENLDPLDQLGADLEIVGPGDAFDQWRESSEYEGWNEQVRP